MNNFLVYVKNVLESHHITYWLDTGNLLEYYRGDILEHNRVDGDLGVLLDDYYKILNLLKHTPRIAFKALWHGEIAIYDKENPSYHVDLFCYSIQGNNMYLHDYIMNSYTKRHDLERNALYYKNKIFPLQKVNYLNSQFYAPIDIETHLTLRYGNWKQPDTKWTWIDAKNVMKNYKELAIIGDYEQKNKIEEMLPKEWYNYYQIDQCYYQEPFLLFLKDWSGEIIPIDKMIYVLTCDEFISHTAVKKLPLNNPMNNFPSKCQKSFLYEIYDNNMNLCIVSPILLKSNSTFTKMALL